MPSTKASRSSKARAVEPDVQLNEMAFTLRNLAIEFNWPERTPAMKILAHGKPSSTPYKKAIKEAETLHEPNILRPSFTFTPEELEDAPNAN